jgi:pyrimidine operon attenuation protein/uracil phosphoribosyltransferase
MKLEVGEPLTRLQRDLEALLRRRSIAAPLVVGIHTGGAWIAARLHAALDLEGPLGSLDISFYRDDFSRIGLNPRVRPSELPLNIDARHVVLVDDVIQTGRTVRAALNELFDFGRPASVMLAVLIDRGGRELPIQPDAVGARVELPRGSEIKLTGPQPLGLEILNTPTPAESR